MEQINEVSALRAELAEMRAELDALRVERPVDDTNEVPLPTEHVNRRQWMKTAAARRSAARQWHSAAASASLRFSYKSV